MSALNISPSSVSLIILKALNGNSSVDVTHADRACDLLSALNISRLSFQVAELRLLRDLLMETAEEAVRNKYNKVVAGAKEEAMHAVHDQLSKSVLKASCRSPASIVLVAEVVVFLDVKLANVTLQKLRSEPGYDDEGHLLLSLLTFGGNALQLHIGQTIKHCILQLDSLCTDEEKQAFLERSVSKQLKLLLPLLGFVLRNRDWRQELCYVLFKLLSFPGVSQATGCLGRVLLHPRWRWRTTLARFFENCSGPSFLLPHRDGWFASLDACSTGSWRQFVKVFLRMELRSIHGRSWTVGRERRRRERPSRFCRVVYASRDLMH